MKIKFWYKLIVILALAIIGISCIIVGSVSNVPVGVTIFMDILGGSLVYLSGVVTAAFYFFKGFGNE